VHLDNDLSDCYGVVVHIGIEISKAAAVRVFMLVRAKVSPISHLRFRR